MRWTLQRSPTPPSRSRAGHLAQCPGRSAMTPRLYEASFIPMTSLAFSTTYTATLTSGIRDSGGEALPAAKTWSFTTEADRLPPQPLVYSPRDGAAGCPAQRPTGRYLGRGAQPGYGHSHQLHTGYQQRDACQRCSELRRRDPHGNLRPGRQPGCGHNVYCHAQERHPGHQRQRHRRRL